MKISKPKFWDQKKSFYSFIFLPLSLLVQLAIFLKKLLIKPINFKQNSNISSISKIKLRLKDEMSGIKSYDAFLNGKWALFEYEPKSNLIFHKISDNIINKGENILLIN